MGKYVIMGIQGSGKGTQAKLLAADYDLVHISMGEVFRGHIRAGTHLGKTIHDLVADGHLVPDSIVNQVLRTRLSEGDCQRGFVLDGYPRDLQQAEVPARPAAARRRDQRGGAGPGRHRAHARPPHLRRVRPRLEPAGPAAAREGRLRRLRRRRRRARGRHARGHRVAAGRLPPQTAPVLDFFREHDLVIDVDGTQAPERVQDEIRRKLGLTVS